MNRRWIAGAAMAVAASVGIDRAAPAADAAQRQRARRRAQSPQTASSARSHGQGGHQPQRLATGAGWITRPPDRAARRLGRRHLRPRDRSAWPARRFFGASERAQGFVATASGCSVQACRRTGSAARGAPDRQVRGVACPGTRRSSRSVAGVGAHRGTQERADSIGLDLTEHGGDGYVEVVLHGEQMRAGCGRPSSPTPPRSPTWACRASATAGPSSGRRRPRAGGRAAQRPDHLPAPGRLQPEMKRWPAEPRPGQADHAAFKRSRAVVHGIEITENVTGARRQAGFLQMGVHHAREWPSGEHAMEWAYELVKGYKARTRASPADEPHAHDRRAGDQPRRLQHLARGGRAPAAGAGRPNANYPVPDPTGTGLIDTTDTTYFATTPYEYQRKNCRVNNPDGRSIPSAATAPSRRGGQHRPIAVRHRPQPQLRRLLGRSGRQCRRSGTWRRLRPGLPRRRPVLRARDPERARPGVRAARSPR